MPPQPNRPAIPQPTQPRPTYDSAPEPQRQRPVPIPPPKKSKWLLPFCRHLLWRLFHASHRHSFDFFHTQQSQIVGGILPRALWMDILWSRTPRENPIMPLITQDATLLSPPFCRPTGRLFHALGRTGSAGAEVCLLLTFPFQSVHRLFTSVFFNSISVFCIIVMNRATCTCSNTYRKGITYGS